MDHPNASLDHILQLAENHKFPDYAPGLIFFLLWHIWKSRNSVIFQQGYFNPYTVLRTTSFLAIKNYNVHHSAHNAYTIERQLIHWVPPAPDVVKLNTDGSASNGNAAIGIILRNNEGNLIAGGSRNLGGSSITAAELVAIRDGLQKAQQLGFAKVEINSDSQYVVRMLQGIYSCCWNRKMLAKQVKQLCSTFELCTVNHVYREANFAADFLAKEGMRLPCSSTVSWITEPVDELQKNLYNDKAQNSVIRDVHCQSV
ncbi:NAD(+) kinase [Ranunculus cassubicifolius]